MRKRRISKDDTYLRMTREAKSNCGAAWGKAQTESTTEKFDCAQDDTFGVRRESRKKLFVSHTELNLKVRRFKVMDVRRERVMECGSECRGAKREGEKAGERDALFYILSAAWGFVTGGAALPFSAVPFGFAAVAVSSRYLISVMVGAVLSCILTRSYELTAAYAVVLLCRLAFSAIAREEKRTRLFCEPLALRAVSAATGALALGVYRLVSAGFLYYHVIGTALTMVISALLVPLWHTAVPRHKSEEKHTQGAWHTVAVCSMAALTVYALSDMFIYGISLSVFAALSITLFAVRHKGVSYGVLMAICTGVFTSVTYAPLFILAAVSFAVLSGVSLGLASFSTLAVGMAWGIYMTGIAAISDLFPGLFAASVVFTVLDKLFWGRVDDIGRSVKEKEKVSNDETRVERLCGALSSLAESVALIEKKFEDPAVAHERVSGGSLLAVIADCASTFVREARSGEVYQADALQKPLLTARTAGRRKNAPQEKDFCGDSFDAVRGEDKKLYAFISDGMGSGREAARASETCAAFLRELLPTGVDARKAFEMLNGFLRICNSESFYECTATADVAQIDLCRARARFYKSGAALTFIFRDGEVKKISARTMPLGLMNDADVAASESEIMSGDVIVMLSDGVTEGREECPELCEFIRSRILTHSADQLADAIIAYTQKRGTQDDVSAVVVKIEQSEII